MIFAIEAVKHVYEVRPRNDKRGIDLISEVLPFGRLWYGEPNPLATQSITRSVAADHCSDHSRLHAAGNVIEAHERKGKYVIERSNRGS